MHDSVLEFILMQVRREFQMMANSNDVESLVDEWRTVWEPKILCYGDKESKTSKTLKAKLSGNCSMHDPMREYSPTLHVL